MGRDNNKQHQRHAVRAAPRRRKAGAHKNVLTQRSHTNTTTKINLHPRSGIDVAATNRGKATFIRAAGHLPPSLRCMRSCSIQMPRIRRANVPQQRRVVALHAVT